MAGINARRKFQTRFVGPTRQITQTRGPVPVVTGTPLRLRLRGLGNGGPVDGSAYNGIVSNPQVVANADGSADLYVPPPPKPTGIAAVPVWGWLLAAAAGYWLLK